jgi:hypothetical protein
MGQEYAGTALSTSLGDVLGQAGWTPEFIKSLPLNRPPAEQVAKPSHILHQRQQVETTKKKIVPLKLARDGRLIVHCGRCRSATH